MYLLNGVPPILGMGMLHVCVLNFLAIFIEFNVIKSRETHKRILLRTILANLVSVIAGFIVLFWIPGLMGANIESTEPELDSFGSFAFILGLAGLFFANVIIEFPFHYIASKSKAGKLFITVLFANFLSNIPVFLMYSLLMF